MRRSTGVTIEGETGSVAIAGAKEVVVAEEVGEAVVEWQSRQVKRRRCKREGKEEKEEETRYRRRPRRCRCYPTGRHGKSPAARLRWFLVPSRSCPHRSYIRAAMAALTMHRI